MSTGAESYLMYKWKKGADLIEQLLDWRYYAPEDAAEATLDGWRVFPFSNGWKSDVTKEDLDRHVSGANSIEDLKPVLLEILRRTLE